MSFNKFYGFKSRIVAGALIAGALLYPISAEAKPEQTPKYIQTSDGRNVSVNSLLEFMAKHESNGDPNAIGNNDDRGIMQITPPVLKEWNEHHPKEQHTSNDLFDPIINKKIGKWYLIDRIIEHYLPAYGLEATLEHSIIAWNDGIGDLVRREQDNTQIPKTTRHYIQKAIEYLFKR